MGVTRSRVTPIPQGVTQIPPPYIGGFGEPSLGKRTYRTPGKGCRKEWLEVSKSNVGTPADLRVLKAHRDAVRETVASMDYRYPDDPELTHLLLLR